MALRIDQILAGSDPSATLADANAAEVAGCGGVFVSEAAHDPFLALVPVATAGGQIEFGTAIAIAFARSPMTLANTAHDLNALSGGRFILGLGSQIRPHITRRFSMPWSQPAARMREFVLALQAIWAAWDRGEPLRFDGEFYSHTLMTPMFTPPASPAGPPRVYLAGVGPRMTQVAGEVADGFFVHPFTSPSYLTEHIRPALGRGLAVSARDSIDVSIALMIATGRDDAEISAATDRIRAQIGFYGSTPAYAPLLAQHGWEALHPELNALSKVGDWSGMAALIDDEIVDTFAIVGDVATVADQVITRWGDLVDRVSISAFGGDRALVAEMTSRLVERAGATPGRSRVDADQVAAGRGDTA